uniref:G-protein coupled receptors family 1 profile domain-containing protein n=1 Tax=Parascaris univalens TaxID=6257 RepID=A0A915C2H8_PARUN
VMDSQHLMASAILLIVCIGVLGNLVSLFMFSRPHMRTASVNVLLSALSAVDLGLLLLSIPVFVVPGLDPWQEDISAQYKYYAYMLKFVYPVNLIMQTCSIYIMLLITVERWTAVCRPLQVRVWCSVRKSRIALLVVLICAILYNFVRFFEYTIEVTPEGDTVYARNLRDPDLYPFYMIGYFTASYLITHFLIPFGIIIVMNGHVCCSMITLRRARLALTRQQQREHSTTFMLMMVTVMFALCNTLPFILNLVECALPDFFSNPETMYFAYQLNDISNLLVILNSATTFIIYFLFSAKYRQTILLFLRHGCFWDHSRGQCYDNGRSHSLRYVSSTRKHSSANALRSENLLAPLAMQKRTERSSSVQCATTAYPKSLFRGASCRAPAPHRCTGRWRETLSGALPETSLRLSDHANKSASQSDNL